MIRYRVVSVAYPSDPNDMWWKIQQIACNGEARWEDAAFSGGVNMFKDIVDCLSKYEELRRNNEACFLEC